MTISNTSHKAEYTGDNSTTAFAFANRFYEDADLVVTVDDVTQTLTTDYTVANNDDESGGTVTFLSAPAAATEIVIYRWLEQTQEVDLTEGGQLSAETLEQALDRLTLITQQISGVLGGATFSVDNTGVIQFLSGGTTAWDADSKLISNVTDPASAQDAATKAYVDSKTSVAGNVPTPDDPGDDGFVLTASSGTYNWAAVDQSIPTPNAGGSDAGAMLRVESGASPDYELRTTTQVRSDLGLGTSATLNVGTSANEIVQLNGSAALPAVDGSNLTGIIEGKWILLDETTLSAASNIEFDNTLITSTYRTYIVVLENITVAADDTELRLTISDDSGVTYENTNYQDAGFSRNSNDAATNYGSTGGSYIRLTLSGATDKIGAMDGESYSGIVRMFNPADADTVQFRVQFEATYHGPTGKFIVLTGGGAYTTTTAAIDSIKIAPSASTFSGTVKLYGLAS